MRVKRVTSKSANERVEAAGVAREMENGLV